MASGSVGWGAYRARTGRGQPSRPEGSSWVFRLHLPGCGGLAVPCPSPEMTARTYCPEPRMCRLIHPSLQPDLASPSWLLGSRLSFLFPSCFFLTLAQLPNPLPFPPSTCLIPSQSFSPIFSSLLPLPMGSYFHFPPLLPPPTPLSSPPSPSLLFLSLCCCVCTCTYVCVRPLSPSVSLVNPLPQHFPSLPL